MPEIHVARVFEAIVVLFLNPCYQVFWWLEHFLLLDSVRSWFKLVNSNSTNILAKNCDYYETCPTGNTRTCTCDFLRSFQKDDSLILRSTCMRFFALPLGAMKFQVAWLCSIIVYVGGFTWGTFELPWFFWLLVFEEFGVYSSVDNELVCDFSLCRFGAMQFKVAWLRSIIVYVGGFTWAMT